MALVTSMSGWISDKMVGAFSFGTKRKNQFKNIGFQNNDLPLSAVPC